MLPVWTLRALFVHQRSLEADAAALFKAIFDAMLDDEHVALLGDADCQAALHVEYAHVCMYHNRFSQGKRHLETAQAILGLTVTLEGALGLRTKYQQEERAQVGIGIS